MDDTLCDVVDDKDRVSAARVRVCGMAFYLLLCAEGSFPVFSSASASSKTALNTWVQLKSNITGQ